MTPEGGSGRTRSRVAKIEDRFLLHALEFESVLRACLYRYSRNASDVEELLQETYARLLVAGSTAQPRYSFDACLLSHGCKKRSAGLATSQADRADRSGS